MSWLSRYREYLQERRVALENARTYRHVRSLPEEIQKDIGWPDASEERRIRDRAGVH